MIGSEHLQNCRGVPTLQWSLSIKGCPRREHWWTSDRVMGSQGSLWEMKASPCVPIQQTSYCRWNCQKMWCWKMSEYTVHCSLLHMERGWAKSAWASELDHRAMEEGGWSNESYCLLHYGCIGCVAYQGNTWSQDALLKEGKLAKSVWCFRQCSTWKPWLLPSIYCKHCWRP